jgi:uroporphyrinogen decarboxylase
MNGYQRTMAAIEGSKPDTPPIMLHNFMLAARESGITMQRFRTSPQAVADSFIASIEKYQYDGVLVDIDTATLAGALGVAVDLPEDEPARCISGRLASLNEVHELSPPDVGSYWCVEVWLEAVRKLREYFGDEILIRGNCDQCPFSLASMVRGAVPWMIDLMDDDNREQVAELLEYCTEATIQFLKLMAEAGAHVLSNGDSPAGPDMISPQMYRKFALPYEQKVAKAAHEVDLPYVLHICGNTGSILEDMLESGADGLEFDQKTDARAAHDLLKGRVTFFGNIDPSGVLALGSTDLVEARTRELLELFSDTPRFVLNAGCAIPANTPGENIRTLIRVAREY